MFKYWLVASFMFAASFVGVPVTHAATIPQQPIYGFLDGKFYDSHQTLLYFCFPDGNCYDIHQNKVDVPYVPLYPSMPTSTPVTQPVTPSQPINNPVVSTSPTSPVPVNPAPIVQPITGATSTPPVIVADPVVQSPIIYSVGETVSWLPGAGANSIVLEFLSKSVFNLSSAAIVTGQENTSNGQYEAFWQPTDNVIPSAFVDGATPSVCGSGTEQIPPCGTDKYGNHIYWVVINDYNSLPYNVTDDGYNSRFIYLFTRVQGPNGYVYSQGSGTVLILSNYGLQ